jgi:ribosomal protein L11 methylase PrmA
MKQTVKKIPGSFRDPSGFLFLKENKLYRTIHNSYKKHYSHLMQSGLYKKLVEKKLLVPHEEVSTQEFFNQTDTYKIIKPEIVPFISYPYEWSFSQLKDAALLTLKIEKIALEYGMTLKDASAYNVQFFNGNPIFIDTLSFETYVEGSPWIAYRQFCQHFLAPLALMAYNNVDLNKLLRIYIDGIPLNIASNLLPFKTHFKPLLQLHIHIHAKSQKKHANNIDIKKSKRKFSKTAFKGLVDHLENGIKKLTWLASGTEWANYYQDDSYTKAGLESKKEIIDSMIRKIKPETIWDLGGNDGTFSRIATNYGAHAVTFDIDPASVEKNYLSVKKNKETNMLPLILDLTNPNPGIGWHNNERNSIIERGPADLVMALALVHHLAISNNVPLTKIAHLFNQMGKNLIIEFVPKSDKKVQKLLATRKDIFSDYTEKHFEKMFYEYFEIKDKKVINDSNRILYWMIREK